MTTKEVVTKDNNDDELTLIVRKPTARQLLEAKEYSLKTFNHALGTDAKTREQMTEHMEKTGIFGESEREKMKEFATKIQEGARQLARGGLTPEGEPFTLEDGKKLAFEMQDWRFEQLKLAFKQRELDEFTLQGRVDNAEFDYLVHSCVFNEEGERYYKTVDDYINKKDDQAAEDSARELRNLHYDVDDSFDKKLPENKFLIKYGFMNDKLQLINEQGKTVDRDNKRIDDKGRWLDDDGNFVDRDGNRVDEDGNPVEDFVEFAH